MHWESVIVQPTNVQGDELIITGSEAHHLSRVLRKRAGDDLWAIDGKGTSYRVEIISCQSNRIRCRVLETRRKLGEPAVHVTLAQALLKGERFDWLVEKATEIGVTTIIPFTCDRTVAASSPQKLSRWRRVASAAVKQSGRSVIPDIGMSKTFEQILTLGVNCAIRLIAHPGNKALTSLPMENNRRNATVRILLVVGPEGGFTNEEIDQAKDQSFQPVSLGPRRLRGETAGIVLLTSLLFKFNEFG